jgi:hypothetical protein
MDPPHEASVLRVRLPHTERIVGRRILAELRPA